MTHSGPFQAVVCNKQIKTELWEVKNDSLQIFLRNEFKVNTQYLIPVNATKLKCLYIETQQFEVKTTLWEGRKKGPVCPH